MTNQKKWTRKVLKYLEKNGFHSTNVIYGDGYFIFPHGKDMVINFHIKEVKGWKFGIWWDINGNSGFDFFAQYEANIDKFKPTASTFVERDVCLEDWNLDDVVRICQFIKKHPHKAWALDKGYEQEIWDLVRVKHPFWRHHFERVRYWWAEVCYKRFNKRYLKLLDEITNECLISPQIIDENKDGLMCSPRYLVKCKGMKDEDLEPGHYDIDIDEDLSPSLKKKALKYEKSLNRKINQPWRTHDINPFGRIGFIISKEKK